MGKVSEEVRNWATVVGVVLAVFGSYYSYFSQVRPVLEGLKEERELVSAYNRIGVHHLARREYEKAELAFKRAMEIKKNDRGSLIGLTNTKVNKLLYDIQETPRLESIREAQLDEAEDLLQFLYYTGYEKTPVLSDIGLLHALKGKWHLGKASYYNSRSAYYELVTGDMEKARTEATKGKAEKQKATEQLGVAIVRFDSARISGSPTASEDLAACYYLLDSLDAAKQHFRVALRLRPNSVVARVNLALIELGSSDSPVWKSMDSLIALKQRLRKVLEDSADYVHAYIPLGFIIHIQATKERDPEQVKRLQKEEEDCYQAALKVNRKFFEALFNLSCLYSEKGDFQQTAEQLQRLVESGWFKFHLIYSEEDLKSFRSSKEFSEFKRWFSPRLSEWLAKDLP